MTDTTHPDGNPAAPYLRAPQMADLTAALKAGLQDFIRAPQYGLFFSLFYVLGGIGIVYLMLLTEMSWAILPIVMGFPLLGPFAAIGLYEVSRRRQNSIPLNFREVLTVMSRQNASQVSTLAATVLIYFLFWNFLAHMIFALHMGLAVMTNVTSSFEVYLTWNGIQMLLIGTVVGAGLSYVLFAMTVFSLPMLLDRNIDFVSAMITSFVVVRDNPKVMLTWGALVVVILGVGMLPAFAGLFIVLPVLGHATWHLYSRLAQPGVGHVVGA